MGWLSTNYSEKLRMRDEQKGLKNRVDYGLKRSLSKKRTNSVPKQFILLDFFKENCLSVRRIAKRHNQVLTPQFKSRKEPLLFMKEVRRSLLGVVLSTIAVLATVGASTSHAVMQPTEVVIQEISGSATYFVAGSWQPLKRDMRLSQGAIIKTDTDSTVDLLFHASATALRLTPSSSLRLDKLNKEAAGEMTVSETALTVLSGGVAGTQRKLAAPSRFQINTAAGVARIVGTEYFVRADGAVSVVSGAVTVNYNKAGSGGSVQVTVQAGFTFDPTTGTVVPTNASYLQNIIAHITTTANNAETFKVTGKATLVVKPEKPVSPHGNDDDHGHGDDNRQGHD
jgi:hypothetical protein